VRQQPCRVSMSNLRRAGRPTCRCHRRRPIRGRTRTVDKLRHSVAVLGQPSFSSDSTPELAGRVGAENPTTLDRRGNRAPPTVAFPTRGQSLVVAAKVSSPVNRFHGHSALGVGLAEDESELVARGGGSLPATRRPPEPGRWLTSEANELRVVGTSPPRGPPPSPEPDASPRPAVPATRTRSP